MWVGLALGLTDDCSSNQRCLPRDEDLLTEREGPKRQEKIVLLMPDTGCLCHSDNMTRLDKCVQDTNATRSGGLH